MNSTAQDLLALMTSAVEFQNSGNFDQARAVYAQILQSQPGQYNVLHNLALIEFKENNTDRAEDYFLQAIKSNSEFYPSKLCLAELYTKQEEYKKAVDLYNIGHIQENKLDNPKLRLDITLKAIISDIIETGKNNQPFELNRIKSFSTSLVQSGQINAFFTPLLTFINNKFQLDQYPERASISISVVLAHLLGLSKASPKEWNDRIFEDFLLPIMKKALQVGYLDVLLELETFIYNNYVKQTETEDHFHHCFSQWLPLMRHAGNGLKTVLPPAPPVNNVAKKTKLGFFFHNTSTMAHTQIVLNFIRGMNAFENPPFQIKIYFFTGDHQHTIQQFLQLGAEVTIISDLQPEGDKSFVNRMIILRNMIAEDDVSALVWVTLPTLMSFAFALRVAPVQIWWGMKYHNLQLPEVDAYLGLGAFEKSRHMYGNDWRIGHTVYASQYTKPDPTLVVQEKYKFSRFETVLSSMAREEKINNPEFLTTLSSILQHNPTACYLWPGKEENKSIKQFLIDAGVADQCIFIGWVDTKLYAEVIDIYLDSFPFPCATTIIDAMLCAKPVVMLNTKESREIGIPMLINPVIESDSVSEEQRNDVKIIFNLKNTSKSNSLLLIADNTDDYQKYSNKLIQDNDFRQASGNAYKTFTEKYLQDIDLMAKSYCSHFTEILELHKNTENCT